MPLPHQITAVYETMLDRQPLRFLLADDPGAGKTIMAGLLIKELIIRGDVDRCLIVSPGGLAEQWQDELDEKFNLPFEILTNEGLTSARTGNWFQKHHLCIARLDKLSRNEEIQGKLAAVDWDLVIVDEAHKMSATYFGAEIKYTKRFKLGQLLSARARQFVLLTATPHNGKDEDFHLFLSWLDGDRFEGKPRDGAHVADVSDVMRRMVKVQLVTMEGKALFPFRRAYTAEYSLSNEEQALYKAVTEYVRREFINADKLNSANARKRADDLNERLQQRRAELALERQVSARPPALLGGALLVPAGWLAAAATSAGDEQPEMMRETPTAYGAADREVERLAMQAVMANERSLGCEPGDVSKENRGCDIESRYPQDHAEQGQLRFIEVKDRVQGAETVTVTKNEILTALNKPDAFILAVVFVGLPGSAGILPAPCVGNGERMDHEGECWPSGDGEAGRMPAVPGVCYITRPFEQEPDFPTASVNFKLKDLLTRGATRGE